MQLRLVTDVVIRNTSNEQLGFQYGCGWPLWLEYEERGTWRPAIEYATRTCLLMGMGRTLAPHDSIVTHAVFEGASGALGDARGDRWVGPVTGRYRLVLRTEGGRRRWQHWRGGREVRLVSRPFVIDGQ